MTNTGWVKTTAGTSAILVCVNQREGLSVHDDGTVVTVAATVQVATRCETRLPVVRRDLQLARMSSALSLRGGGKGHVERDYDRLMRMRRMVEARNGMGLEEALCAVASA